MYQIIGKRGSGKTINLITLAKENNAILVTCCPEYVLQKMYDLGITGIEVMSYGQFQAGLYNFGKDKPYIIDELEAYTKFTSGRNLIGFSLSLNESSKENN